MLFPRQYPEYSVLYRITHLCHGALIYLTKNIPICSDIFFIHAFLYQTFQYATNRRIYIPRREVLQEHNLKHLINKLSEYVLGFIVGVVVWWSFGLVGPR